MPVCLVKGCLSRWGRKNDEHILHVFPTNVETCTKWLIQLGYEGTEMEEFLQKIAVNQRKGLYRICSKHFSKNCYEKRATGWSLKKGSIPTLFLQPKPENEHDYAKPNCSTQLETIKTTPSELSQIPDTESLMEHSCLTQEEDRACTAESHDLSVLSADEAIVDISDVLTEEVVSFESLPGTSFNLDATKSKTETIKKRKRQRHVRSVGISTALYHEQKHKHTQFDYFYGMKHKRIQVFHRNQHRSIGIQCNMELVSGSTETNRTKKLSVEGNEQLRILSRHPDPEFNPVIENVQESLIKQVTHEQLKTNYPSTRQATSLLRMQTKLRSDSDEFETPQKKKINESYQPTAEEEIKFEQELMKNEEIYCDPKDLDSSYILMPGCTEKKHPAKENKFIVFESCLDQLLLSSRCKGQIDCPGTIVKIKKYRLGTAISVSGYCSEKHRFHLWHSQPLISKMPMGNLLLSAGVWCTGSNFLKVESLFSVLGIYGISKNTDCENKKKYLFPTIEYHWQKNRLQILEDIGNQPVALSGDGHFYSPEQDTKYCTYSFLDNKTKKIIDFQVEQLHPGTSTSNLEAKACKIGLDRLMQDNINVHILCTNSNGSMRKMMKNKYTDIVHKFSVYHVAKSIGSKIAAVSKETGMSSLASWVVPAKNHLWWSAQISGLDPQMLKEQWSSIIYHVSNIHTWTDGKVYKKCHHTPLTKEQEKQKQWLEFGSPAHTKLKEIILNPRCLKDIEQLSHFCCAGDLELLHGTSLKYHSKQKHKFIESMVARAQLAALDYNCNTGRLQAVEQHIGLNRKESESPENQFAFQNSQRDCVVERIVEKPNQDFLLDIMVDVVEFAFGNKNFER